MKQPVESEYKDWTDYAEAMLAYKDFEIEQIKEKADFLDGGYQSRQRRIVKMMNAGERPTAWQLSHCNIEFLVDTTIDLINKNRALKHLRVSDQKDNKALKDIILSADMTSAKLREEIAKLNSEMPVPPPPGPEMI